jgi:very-short-patch-repair endonuclease
VQHELDAFGPGRLGSDVAQRALDRRRPGDRLPESVLESAFDALVRRFGLPIPVRQHEIRDTSGALVARVDFAYLDARLAIEIDSVRFHAGVAWQEDLRRQNAVGTQKWRMLRFTHDDLQQRPADVAATILESLQ